jgi:DNA invertase Pin-like site-specific DNA recombinase
MTTAVIYVRISSDRDGLREGVERQLEDSQALCERHGWQVAQVYEDNDTSAYSGKPRPRYLAMLDAVRSGQVDAIVAWHPDRLHRSPRELEDFIDLLEATGTEVVTVQSGRYDLSTSSGRQVARIVGAVARGESEHKSERVKRKHQQIGEQGRWHGGPRPFGYAYADDGSGDLVIVPEEAAAIRKAAERISRGASVASIAREWNAAGLVTPRGNSWLSAPVSRLLRSPVLRGKRVYRGVEYDAQWPAILTDEAGHTLTAILSAPARKTSHTNARKNPLAGFLFCGVCGGPLSSGNTNGLPAMKCQKGKTAKSCGGMTCKLEPLTEAMGDIIVERLLLARQTLRKAAKASTKNDDGTSVARELDAIRARQTELEAMFTEGDIDGNAYKRMASDLERRLASAMASLAQTAEHASLNGVPTTRAGLEALWDDGDLEARTNLMRLVFVSVTIAPAPHRGARFTPARILPTFRNLG